SRGVPHANREQDRENDVASDRRHQHQAPIAPVARQPETQGKRERQSQGQGKNRPQQARGQRIDAGHRDKGRNRAATPQQHGHAAHRQRQEAGSARDRRRDSHRQNGLVHSRSTSARLSPTSFRRRSSSAAR